MALQDKFELTVIYFSRSMRGLGRPPWMLIQIATLFLTHNVELKEGRTRKGREGKGKGDKERVRRTRRRGRLVKARCDCAGGNNKGGGGRERKDER